MTNTEDPDIAMARFIAQFRNDPLGFVMAVYPWDSDSGLQLVRLPPKYRSRFPRCEYGPDLWACEFLDELGRRCRENRFDGVNAVPATRMAVASGHGIGKGLPLDAIVDTPHGVKRWGDLRIGDELWGPDGKPTRVVAFPYHGVRPCYRVTFDDGSSTVVSREHLWTVRGRQQRRRGTNEYITLSTEELIARGVKRPNGVALARQWELPPHRAVQYSEAALPIHPYLLGLFIGNGLGVSHGLAFGVSADDVLKKALRLAGVNVRVVSGHRHDAGYTEVHVHGAHGAMRALGLASCRSDEKFIPQAYKEASVEQRAELLRGLFDTDGEVTRRGSVIYSTTSAQLRDDVLWLVRSLGGKAQVHPTTKQPFYYDERGERVQCRPCYRVTLTMPRDFAWGAYAKRTARVRDAVESRYLVRWIDSIEPVGELDTMCVTVDRDDGLYLANDFIVTHNSAMTAWLVHWIMSTRANCHGTVTANTANQLASKTWASVTAWVKRSINANWFTINTNKGNLKMTCKFAPEDWFVTGQTCRKEDAESFAGQHAANSSSFYIFDEASSIPNEIWEVAEGGLTDGEPFLFAFGNPTRNSGRFYDCFKKDSSLFSTHRVDSRECQITNKETIARWEKEYGEDSDFFRVRVKGEFPNVSSTQFIPTGLVEEAMSRDDLPYDPRLDTQAIMGVDVARFGDDDTVIVVRVGKTIPIRKRFHGLDGFEIYQQVAALVNHCYEELHMDEVYVNVDAGGVGASPIDFLNRNGFSELVFGVNFGGKADDPVTYYNKRVEMWGGARDWLKTASLPKDADLLEELTAPEYRYTPSGQLQLEAKDDIKARIGRSPDEADAIALTFARRILSPEARKRARPYRSLNPMSGYRYANPDTQPTRRW